MSEDTTEITINIPTVYLGFIEERGGNVPERLSKGVSSIVTQWIYDRSAENSRKRDRPLTIEDLTKRIIALESQNKLLVKAVTRLNRMIDTNIPEVELASAVPTDDTVSSPEPAERAWL